MRFKIHPKSIDSHPQIDLIKKEITKAKKTVNLNENEVISGRPNNDFSCSAEPKPNHNKNGRTVTEHFTTKNKILWSKIDRNTEVSIIHLLDLAHKIKFYNKN